MSASARQAGCGASALASDQPGKAVVGEDERAVQIAAAQLRIITDRRLGKETPGWVKNLAAEQPK